MEKINDTILKTKKVKSAFRTTFGGVKRDLKEFDKALSFGNQAHIITPNNFRPCTLLGAVNMELGKYEEGQSWYEKARKLGAPQKLIDDDLRSILMGSDKSKRKDLAKFLYKNDPDRYSWIKNILNKIE